MNSLEIISFEKVWSEIKKAYNPTFLEELMKIPGIQVYAFGGIIMDTSLSKPWKDLDLRLILNTPPEKQKGLILAVLKKYAVIVQKIDFPDGWVVRIKIPDGKDVIIDVGVSDSFEKFRGDFKACSIFINLKTGELVELGESCVDDFRNRIIRSLDEPRAQLEGDPTHLFRALKLAAKTGFTIDSKFGEILKEKKSLARKVIVDLLSYIKTNGKDSYAEYFLGNVFGGLKGDAILYIKLLHEYGFLDEIYKALQRLGYGDKSRTEVKEESKLFGGVDIFEDKISLFLSMVAKAINHNPTVCFETLKKDFALDTNRSDGNEFSIDPSKIIFIP